MNFTDYEFQRNLRTGSINWFSPYDTAINITFDNLHAETKFNSIQAVRIEEKAPKKSFHVRELSLLKRSPDIVRRTSALA